MTIATLTRDLAQEPVRTGLSLGRRIIRFFVALDEIWTETQEMRREAQRRYPHLEF
jgi:hypothetical protein